MFLFLPFFAIMNLVLPVFRRSALLLLALVSAVFLTLGAVPQARGQTTPPPLAVEEEMVMARLETKKMELRAKEEEVQRLLTAYKAAPGVVDARKAALAEAEKAAKTVGEAAASEEQKYEAAKKLAGVEKDAAAGAISKVLTANKAALEGAEGPAKTAAKQAVTGAATAAAAEQAVKDAAAAVAAAQEGVTAADRSLQTAQEERLALQREEEGLARRLDEVRNIRENAVALGSRAIYEQSLKALTILFVVAVLLENALAVLFSWRFFLAYVNARVARTPIMVIAATVVVFAFGLDVLASLIAIYKAPEGVAPDFAANAPNWFSKFMTALIIAGGSAGVTNLMRALGYRKNAPEENVPTGPKAKQGWVSVRLKRKVLVGDARVRLELVTPQPTPLPAPIVGTINAELPPVERLFLRNKDHFPQNGGYPVDVDKAYRLIVEGEDATGKTHSKPSADFTVAERAIVDFEMEL